MRFLRFIVKELTRLAQQAFINSLSDNLIQRIQDLMTLMIYQNDGRGFVAVISYAYGDTEHINGWLIHGTDR